MEYFFIGVISAAITGVIAEIIGQKKNQKAFIWGFLLSWIGIIVVACMPYNEDKRKSRFKKLEELQELKEKNVISNEVFENEKKRILNS